MIAKTELCSTCALIIYGFSQCFDSPGIQVLSFEVACAFITVLTYISGFLFTNINICVMMMTFIFSSRNNKQPNAIYPLGTFHWGLMKARVMMLPSCPLWYYDVLFFPLVDVVVH